jgi:hypothetical protein
LELQPVLYEKASNIGLSKLQIRPYTIQVGTGHLVEVENYYGLKYLRLLNKNDKNNTVKQVTLAFPNHIFCLKSIRFFAFC